MDRTDDLMDSMRDAAKHAEEVNADKPQAVTLWDWLGIAAYVAIVFILSVVVVAVLLTLAEVLKRWIG